VGGALELVGAAALILTPEPTTITKIAGGALAIHGADTTSSAIVQIATRAIDDQGRRCAFEGGLAEPDQLRTDVISEAFLGGPSMPDYPQRSRP
jgi:hypothetical protein